MKRSLLISAFCFQLSAFASPDAGRLADAIYRAEGGPRARVPYGILSIKVRDEKHARQICLNSIRNNLARWRAAQASSSSNPLDPRFIDFMADRWCPPSVDPIGNRNWKKNVKALTR